MTYEELTQIVDRATKKLHEHGVNIDFDARATDTLASAAAGFPWFVHLLGQAALLQADEERQDVVTDLHVVGAVRSLMTNRLAQQFSDLYQTAVRDSARRESVLRALALWDERDIPTTEVYRIVRSLGVTNPSAHIAQLCSAPYGSVLLRSDTRGIVCFANEMFKVYARIRPSLYAALDVRMRQAYRKRHDR